MKFPSRLPLAIGACVFLLHAAPVAASSITYIFDCDITGPTCTPTTPVGQLSITDSGSDTNAVDLVLSLVSGDPQSLFINYNGFPLPTGFSFVSSASSVDVNQDSQQADGYTVGLFDLKFPDNGNISGNPFTTTLTLTDGVGGFVDLSALDFLAQSTDVALFAAVLKTQGNSWFGSTTCEGTDCAQFIPEPASLSLFAAGLAGVLATMRGRRRVRQ